MEKEEIPMTLPGEEKATPEPWPIQALRKTVENGRTDQGCPVASIDWILGEYERLRAALEKIENIGCECPPPDSGCGYCLSRCNEIAREALNNGKEG